MKSLNQIKKEVEKVRTSSNRARYPKDLVTSVVGSKTINGADTAATLYTVTESCKKAQLDPVDYIKYVVTENNTDREPLTPLQLAKKQNQP